MGSPASFSTAGALLKVRFFVSARWLREIHPRLGCSAVSRAPNLAARPGTRNRHVNRSRSHVLRLL